MSSKMAPKSNDAGANYTILFFFFLTGLTGLVYELVWIRLLTLAFGSTQFAITTVLVTFMAGLALGSLLFGRIVDRLKRPVMMYAAIEILLGLYCILSPAVFELLRSVYLRNFSEGSVVSAGFEPTQFLLSFAGLIVPTTLMGGTLPVLVKYLTETRERVGFNTAVPYSINTLGAVSGCLVTGFFALYLLGVKTTLYGAGIIDILIGGLILLIYAPTECVKTAQARISTDNTAEIPAPGPETDLGRGVTFVILISLALSGFASLSYEVLWSRIFSLIIGSSIYAFTIMLATFLAGIGIGSILFAPFIDRRKNPFLWFAGLEVVIGLVALFSIFIYRELPFIFFILKESLADRFWLFLFVQFALCALIMIIPTICMGAIFPLAGRIYTRSASTVGSSIGDIYFFNTAGSIFGAFAAGFILIPLIGIQRSVVITSMLNIMVAVALFNISALRSFPRVAVSFSLASVFMVTSLMLPSWEKTVMTLGLYSNPLKGFVVEQIKKGNYPNRLLYYKEGLNAVITVRQGGIDGKTISYQANGKLEARATREKPPEAWSLLGHIPMLMHGGEPKEALLVGLGSGITLGAMEQYPLGSIDVVELEPAVVEAAGFFKEANNNALEDKRVRLHVTDGRNFLFTTNKTYDVIVSAVSDPWITGVSNLFTYEYFSELSNKLKTGGVVSMWFQNYRITPRELKIGLNTFASVFPYVSIWFHYTDTLDLIVIGSKEEHRFGLERLRESLSRGTVKDDLERINIETPYDLLDTFLIGNDDLRAYTVNAPLNTDERPILEFTLPKYQYMDPKMAIEMMNDILKNVKEVVPPVVIPDGREELFYYNLASTYSRSNFRLGQALVVFEKVLEVNPDNIEARSHMESIRKELKL